MMGQFSEETIVPSFITCQNNEWMKIVGELRIPVTSFHDNDNSKRVCTTGTILGAAKACFNHPTCFFYPYQEVSELGSRVSYLGRLGSVTLKK